MSKIEVNYTFSPIMRQLARDDEHRVRIAKGPIGCLPAHTDVLTPDGWINIAEWSGQDIGEFNPHTGSVEFRQPKAYINEPYDGAWFTFLDHARGFCMTVTPNHTIVGLDPKSNDWVSYPAHMVAEGIVEVSVPTYPEFFVCPSTDSYPSFGSYASEGVQAIKHRTLSGNNDRQYCFTTTTGAFVVRQKDTVFVTGNSGKSTAMCAETFRRMQEVPAGKGGLRYSQFAVVRNTLQQLKTTVLPVIEGLFGPLFHYKVSDSALIFEFADVRSTWILLPLDTPQNVERLLSLELTGAWMSEVREMPVELVKDVFSRCGRYPSMMKHGADPSWYGIVAETNCWDEDSGWYAATLDENISPLWAIYSQPAAVEVIDDTDPLSPVVNVVGENAENLPPDYYTDLIRANGGIHSRWVRQYILNEVTESLAGEGVFSNAYNRKFHEYESISPVPGSALCIGLDTGRNPAAVLGQVDPNGVLRILCSTYLSNVGMEFFLNERLLPLLRRPEYMGLPTYAIVDPAGNQRSQIGEESVTAAVNRMGIPAFPARTNNIEPRLRAVEGWLCRQIGGEAAIQFSIEGNPDLIRGMRGAYRYERKKKDRELDDVKPMKTHPISDVCDALQYLCLGTSEQVRTAILKRLAPPPPPKPMPIGAWT